jgi:hypothetical protein
MPKLGLGLLAGLIVAWTALVLVRRTSTPRAADTLVTAPE